MVGVLIYLPQVSACMRQWIMWALVQIVAYSAPSHYLNQWWVIVNSTLRNKLQWNFNQSTNFYIHENASEKHRLQNGVHFVQGRWFDCGGSQKTSEWGVRLSTPYSALPGLCIICFIQWSPYALSRTHLRPEWKSTDQTQSTNYLKSSQIGSKYNHVSLKQWPMCYILWRGHYATCCDCTGNWLDCITVFAA